MTTLLIAVVLLFLAFCWMVASSFLLRGLLAGLLILLLVRLFSKSRGTRGWGWYILGVVVLALVLISWVRQG